MDDEGYGTIDRADGTLRSRACSTTDSPVVRMAPIQRKDVPYTIPVPAPAVKSVHGPATRKDVIPTTSHADNYYRTLRRSRFYQQLLMSNPATQKEVIHTTTRADNHHLSRPSERSRCYQQPLVSRCRSSMSSRLGGHQGQMYQGTMTGVRHSLALIPEYTQ